MNMFFFTLSESPPLIGSIQL